MRYTPEEEDRALSRLYLDVQASPDPARPGRNRALTHVLLAVLLGIVVFILMIN